MLFLCDTGFIYLRVFGRSIGRRFVSHLWCFRGGLGGYYLRRAIRLRFRITALRVVRNR